MNNKVYNSNSNTEPVPKKEVKKMDKGKELGLIVLFIGILLIVAGISFLNLYPEDTTTTSNNENNSFSGIYTKENIEVKIYQKDDDKLSYTINGAGTFQGTADISGKEAKGELIDTNFTFTISKKGINIDTNEDSIPKGDYEKTSDYTMNDYYKDVIGDPKYLESEYNGVFKNGNNKILLFQTGEKEVKLVLTANTEGYTYIEKILEIQGDKSLKEQPFSEDDTSPLARVQVFGEEKLGYVVDVVNPEDADAAAYNGYYAKEKALTMEEILKEVVA